MFEKSKQWLLSKSNSFNYYKNENEKLLQDIDKYEENNMILTKQLDEVSKQLKKNEKKLVKFQKQVKKDNIQNKKILDSYNKQFSTLFLYYDLQVKGSLRNFQIFNQELLNFIVNVCKKYNINYWLDYGTLLGAVRHGGYIPWDDDIDIGMMRKDYDKFIKVLNNELELNEITDDVRVTVNDRVLSNGFKISFFQIIFKSHLGHMLAGMDVFPYDFIHECDESFETKFNNEQINFNNRMKEGQDIDEYLKDYFKKFEISLEKEKYIIPGLENVRGKVKQYKFVACPYDYIFPLRKIKFNNIYYSAPQKINLYLEDIYGDYKTIPKIIKHHDRAKELKSYYDDEYYEKYIHKLKVINERYD